MAYAPRGIGTLSYARGGIARLDRGTARGQTYTVWSSVRHPTPAQLARSKPRYPYGDHRRSGRVRASVRRGRPRPEGVGDDRGAHTRVRLLVRRGKGDVDARRTRTPRSSRSSPGCGTAAGSTMRSIAVCPGSPPAGLVRDPDPPRLLPALRGSDGADAAVSGHPCARGGRLRERHLLRRLLGVSDHDAHTWVEVWFRGQGWLPFDPTPGRGRLDVSYSASSECFDPGAAAALVGAGTAIQRLLRNEALSSSSVRGEHARSVPVAPEDSHRTLLIVGLVLLAAIGLEICPSSRPKP